MIIGDKYIFVQNPKTACKSIQTLLESAGGRKLGNMHFNLRDYGMSGQSGRIYDMPRRKFRFVVVRNPWDRMVSGFYFQSGGKMSFKKWVLGEPWSVTPGVDFKRTPQYFWAYHCNSILKFEKLEEHLGVLLPKIGVEEWTLPHEHKSNGRGHYRDYYDDETRAVVADRFYHDIKTFGYSFD